MSEEDKTQTNNDSAEKIQLDSQENEPAMTTGAGTVISETESTTATTATTLESLGPGPLRFAASEEERPLSEQIASLSTEEKQCYDNLRTRWNALHPDRPYSDEMFLRFARCSPGKTKFNEKSAWRVMNKFDRRYLVLSADRLEPQLLSKTLFPVPGLMTKEGHDVFYMRASRYFPKETSTKTIIDNLAYCMTTMVEKEKACTEGIAFLAYMNDFQLKNFSADYFVQFMRMLQGRIPVRVRLFLIVNPPKLFDRVWVVIKPLLLKDFQNKVRMIRDETSLGEFLMDNYTDYLPNDMETGTQDTEAMVQDYVTYRKCVEANNQRLLMMNSTREEETEDDESKRSLMLLSTPPVEDGDDTEDEKLTSLAQAVEKAAVEDNKDAVVAE